MVDYKKMYQIMVTETENAINTLIAAQRRCEEMFLEGKDAEDLGTANEISNEERQHL